ncbi:MAG: hypothetical protein ACXAC2_00260 [Candidatus Kariarchaeaceae archaeon]|jgi:hypothetical protein
MKDFNSVLGDIQISTTNLRNMGLPLKEIITEKEQDILRTIRNILDKLDKKYYK